ncbi:MAG TPA: phosphotransferase, partial [Vicinamibacterales bacterium]|nr:phosphotransferase [Vicinamibacterales bacterium]
MSHPVIVQFAPRFTALQALGILRALYGREGSLEALPSERDQNFKVVAPDGAAFVLKIANGTERAEVLDFENRAIAHLARTARNLSVPRLVPTLDGGEMGLVSGDASDAQHFVRLLTWIPGVPLALVKPHSEALLVSLGRTLAEMDRAFEGFEHPAMH